MDRIIEQEVTHSFCLSNGQVVRGYPNADIRVYESDVKSYTLLKEKTLFDKVFELQDGRVILHGICPPMTILGEAIHNLPDNSDFTQLSNGKLVSVGDKIRMKVQSLKDRKREIIYVRNDIVSLRGLENSTIVAIILRNELYSLMMHV